LSVRKFSSDIHKAYVKVKHLHFKIHIFNASEDKFFKKYFKGEKSSFVPAEQLFWREFFYHLSYKNEKFDQIDGNIMSFKIPWDWNRNDLFAKWEEVNT
jgi:deoxyribodipyrimidine photolyase